MEGRCWKRWRGAEVPAGGGLVCEPSLKTLKHFPC